jgi:hypothetical protein
VAPFLDTSPHCHEACAPSCRECVRLAEQKALEPADGDAWQRGFRAGACATLVLLFAVAVLVVMVVNRVTGAA